MLLLPVPHRPHTARNDKIKLADILQVRKGDIQFRHRFPVRYLGNGITGGAQAHQPGYHLKSPFQGFRMNPWQDFAITEPCVAWLHFINPERVMRK